MSRTSREEFRQEHQARKGIVHIVREERGGCTGQPFSELAERLQVQDKRPDPQSSSRIGEIKTGKPQRVSGEVRKKPSPPQEEGVVLLLCPKKAFGHLSDNNIMTLEIHNQAGEVIRTETGRLVTG